MIELGRIEKITLQHQKGDGLVLPHAIIRRRAGPNVHYFRVIGYQGDHYICTEITVSGIRRFIDNLLEKFLSFLRKLKEG